METELEQYAGVYVILHISTGKMYVGSTGRRIELRLKEHVRELNRGAHFNPQLQNAWSKYGQEAFEFKTILVCDPGDAPLYEQIVIDSFKPSYNICPVAESRLGAKLSEASRYKMSVAKTGAKHPLYGKGHTDEARAKMRTAKKGEKHGRAKLTEVQVYQIKIDLRDGRTIASLARKHGVHASSISYIRSGRTWAHVTIPND